MKIRPVSDLHLEFFEEQINIDEIIHPSPSDNEMVLVLAADIEGVGNIIRLESMLRHLGARFRSVIYIFGNHEFYGTDMVKLRRTIPELEVPDNVHLLDEDYVEIDGVTFFGGTMWTNMNNRDPLLMVQAQGMMTDFKQIKKSRTRLKPTDLPYLFYSFVHRLNAVAAEAEQLVVVSHHAPSFKSIHPDYVETKFNSLYASDLDGLIRRIQPTLWIHGHIHSSTWYEIGETQVVANPRGYYFEQNPDFDPDLVVFV